MKKPILEIKKNKKRRRNMTPEEIQNRKSIRKEKVKDVLRGVGRKVPQVLDLIGSIKDLDIVEVIDKSKDILKKDMSRKVIENQDQSIDLTDDITFIEQHIEQLEEIKSEMARDTYTVESEFDVEVNDSVVLDRQNSREMFPLVYKAVTIATTFVVLGGLIFGLIAAAFMKVKNPEDFASLLEWFKNGGFLIVGFAFGSSFGSRQKTIKDTIVDSSIRK